MQEDVHSSAAAALPGAVQGSHAPVVLACREGVLETCGCVAMCVRAHVRSLMVPGSAKFLMRERKQEI